MEQAKLEGLVKIRKDKSLLFFVFPSEAAKRIFYNLFYAYYIIAKRILFC